MMEIQKLYSLYSVNYLVDTDTRKIREKTIFFALKGNNFNGNEFAEEALKKGAIYSVVDQIEYVTNNRIIYVENVLKTLQELANYHRNQINAKIIALTGSNGKTTTKELINAVLSKKYKTKATIGNLNNHIGVPLTLLSIKPDIEVAIVEMGANHKKEISFLCKIAAPDYGYITNFGSAHLEGFGSLEGVIEGKTELYDYLTANGRIIFVNPKDEIQFQKTKETNRMIFDDNLEIVKSEPFLILKYKELEINTQLIGRYNFENIHAAITIGNYFEVSDKEIQTAIESYIPTNNRSQIIQTSKNKIVLDAYNANPTSMEAAIENFTFLNEKKKMLILGDMFELGKFSYQEHQKIADLASSNAFDEVIFVGDNFHQIETKNRQFKKFEELKNYLEKQNIVDYTILIKGSRSMKLERIVDLID